MENDEKDKERLLELAYLAVAQKKFNTAADLDQAVTKEYLRLRYIMSEKSVARRVADAVVITAEIKKVTYEQSSMRYVIEFVAVNGDGKLESVRTDRTDGPNGLWIADNIGDELVGHRARIYKVNEHGGKAADRGSGFRVTPYLRVIDDGPRP